MGLATRRGGLQGTCARWGLYFLTLAISLTARAVDIELQRGAYMTRAAGCADCHTTNSNQPFAGGYRVETPFGHFFGPNITPDPTTGIGGWSEADFRLALRDGVDRHQKFLYPAFPFRSYTKMTDEDIRAIYRYMMSVDPVRRGNLEHELRFPFNQRNALFVWRNLFFRDRNQNFLGLGPQDDFGFMPIRDDERTETLTRHIDELKIRIGRGAMIPAPHRSPEWNRGAYLVEAVTHCTECHTPRNQMGGLKVSKWMAGTIDSINNVVIPNITPDRDTGLASWRKTDWIRFLESGMTPKNSSVGTEMAEVVKNTSTLTHFDRAAMADYLMSLPAVRNRLSKSYNDIPESRFVLSEIASSTPSTSPLPAATSALVQQCTQCHAGRSSDNDAKPLLDGQGDAYLILQLKRYLVQERRDPKGEMNDAVLALSSDDIRDVARYFAAKPMPVNDRTPTFRERNLIERGRKLAEVSCVNCHMNSENNNRPINAFVPALAGQSKQYLIKRMHYFASKEGASSPLMHQLAKKLNEADVENLALYFNFQK